jgi:hypothetical protein
MGVAFVEDTIFDDEPSAGVKNSGQFANERFVVGLALSMNDVRKKNDIIASPDRVLSIVAWNQPDSILQASRT